jgi:hypothetical protein
MRAQIGHLNRPGRYGVLALILLSLTMLATGFVPSAFRRQCRTLTVTGPDSAPPGDQMTYNASPDVGKPFKWTVNAGRIDSGPPSSEIVVVGVYTRSVRVTAENPGCNNRAVKVTQITGPQPCPTVSVSCPDQATQGERASSAPDASSAADITFTANISGGDPDVPPTFNWTISAGTIKSGQGTSSITVDISGLESGTSVTATVDVGGYDRSCSTSASCSTTITRKR